MLRSLHPSVSFCLLLALSPMPSLARAQDFTEADLVGDYGVQASEQVSPIFGATGAGVLNLAGRFTADGLGGLTGSWSFSRPVRGSSSGTLVIETLEQEFTGTYWVGADGRGETTLTITPNTVWLQPYNSLATEFDDAQTLDFVLVDGGRQLLLSVDMAGRLLETPGGREAGPEVRRLQGQAVRQRAPDDLAERVELLTELVARQSAQLCELLRLVNTPQGQRETSTPEVVEACGTGYQWNGEGTGVPRRGR